MVLLDTHVFLQFTLYLFIRYGLQRANFNETDDFFKTYISLSLKVPNYFLA